MISLYPFGKAVTNLYVQLMFSIRYEGVENIPTDHGFILACNHRSNNDPVFIAHKVKLPLHFMAKAELFKMFFLSFILPRVNAFPIERGTGDTGSMETAANIIRQSGALVMFIEGTRSKDGTLGRPRSGVALIAGQTAADVLPCCVHYEGKLTFRKRVTIKYGEIIPNQQLEIDPQSSKSVRSASKLIMGKIAEMLQRPNKA